MSWKATCEWTTCESFCPDEARGYSPNDGHSKTESGGWRRISSKPLQAVRRQADFNWQQKGMLVALVHNTVQKSVCLCFQTDIVIHSSFIWILSDTKILFCVTHTPHGLKMWLLKEKYLVNFMTVKMSSSFDKFSQQRESFKWLKKHL